MIKLKNFCSKNTLVLVVAVMFLFCSLYNKTFLTAFNIGGMMTEAAFMTFLAIGMTFVILTGGIDLSVGAVAGLSTVIIALTMKYLNTGSDILTIFIGVVFAIITSMLLGFVNGIFVTRLKLPPLIVTLGMTWIASGIGQSLLKGSPLALAIKPYKTVMETKLFGWIPVTFLLALAVLIIMIQVLKKYRWGREFYAVGSNTYAAFISGTKTNNVLIRAYTLSGLFAGVAGLLIAAYTGSGYPGAANNYELYTIAAVVMGGISLTGGEGRLFLALFGVFVLRLLNKLVIFTGLSSISGFIEGAIIGTILIAVLLINSVRKGEK